MHKIIVGELMKDSWAEQIVFIAVVLLLIFIKTYWENLKKY